eukprot:6199171-Pleurochrysis_carterae.AAC.6
MPVATGNTKHRAADRSMSGTRPTPRASCNQSQSQTQFKLSSDTEHLEVITDIIKVVIVN